MAEDTNNPFIVSKPADSPLTISLHPLVLLTASDLITRHNIRQGKGPLAGILLGQQKGQETTAEHAFAANLQNANGHWLMDQEWTNARIQQFKDVHKAPALEVVGWFALCPESGPSSEHVTIQKQFEALFNENGIFLAIHPASISHTDTANKKLPLSVYESVLENEETSMQIDDQDYSNIRFRQLPYSIETDETEMIAIDYVAKGAGSAAAVDANTSTSTVEVKQETRGKSGTDVAHPKLQNNTNTDHLNLLTTEEEDQIAGMTTRLNSVKMLHTRLQILSRFIQTLPPSYISDQTIPLSANSPDPSSLIHLRNIQALLTRLSLLTPTADTSEQSQQTQGQDALQDATRAQFNDVSLISMLSQLGQDVQGLNELGRKFAQVEQGKSVRGKKNGGLGANPYGGFADGDGRSGGFTVADRMGLMQ